MRVHSAVRTCTTWWSTLLLIRRGGPARIGCRSGCTRLLFSLEFQISLFRTHARGATQAKHAGTPPLSRIRDPADRDARPMQDAAPMY